MTKGLITLASFKKLIIPHYVVFPQKLQLRSSRHSCSMSHRCALRIELMSVCNRIWLAALADRCAWKQVLASHHHLMNIPVVSIFVLFRKVQSQIILTEQCSFYQLINIFCQLLLSFDLNGNSICYNQLVVCLSV